jgi:thiamine-phosphate pyrophosphorylase
LPPAPRLYLITDRSATGGRPLGQVVAAALRGVEPFRAADGSLPIAVSLREKDLGGRALLALARELGALTRAAGARLFINGRVDVALAAGADGVHLPGDGLAPADVRAIAPALAIVVSAHTKKDIDAAAEAGAAFAVFGPVFDTPSKRGILKPVGLLELRAATRSRLPVLALGGVTLRDAGACARAGAAGIACIRAILGAADPERVAGEFIRGFDAEKRDSGA